MCDNATRKNNHWFCSTPCNHPEIKRKLMKNSSTPLPTNPASFHRQSYQVDGNCELHIQKPVVTMVKSRYGWFQTRELTAVVHIRSMRTKIPKSYSTTNAALTIYATLNRRKYVFCQNILDSCPGMFIIYLFFGPKINIWKRLEN